MGSLMDTAREVVSEGRKLSKLLVFSYIVDWILIIGTAGVGGAFHAIDPSRHTFSLKDPSISYLYTDPDTISTATLFLVSLVAPGVIIAFASLFLVPVSAVNKDIPRSLLWRRKLWEWNVGWMGLAFALAGAFMVTEGLKDLYGKPRPDMLSRCNPDLSDIAAHAVSGLGQDLPGAPVMVSWTICRNKSIILSRDGFVSFPSGHSSFSWAGLGYLTFWICSKLAVRIPYLRKSTLNGGEQTRQSSTYDKAESETGSCQPSLSGSPRTGAAPPVYFVILAFIPIGTAFYISSTRWVDNRHTGFDIICGSLLGIGFAWLGFRLYHPPLTRGTGWAWPARSPSRALFTRIGDSGWAASYPGPDLGKKHDRPADVEKAVPAPDDGHDSAVASGAAPTNIDGEGAEGNRAARGSSTVV